MRACVAHHGARFTTTLEAADVCNRTNRTTSSKDCSWPIPLNNSATERGSPVAGGGVQERIRSSASSPVGGDSTRFWAPGWISMVAFRLKRVLVVLAESA